MAKKINKFSKLLKRASMSTTNASKFLKFDQTTIDRWRRGETIPHPTVIMCLQSVVSGKPVNADELILQDRLIDSLETIIKAVQVDPSYAYTWHCNVADSVVASGVTTLVANEAAGRFMHTYFQVDTITGNKYEPNAEAFKDSK